MPIPDELPGPHLRQSAAYRLPALDLAVARARADMEGAILTEVIAAALRACGTGAGVARGILRPHGRRPDPPLVIVGGQRTPQGGMDEARCPVTT